MNVVISQWLPPFLIIERIKLLIYLKTYSPPTRHGIDSPISHHPLKIVLAWRCECDRDGCDIQGAHGVPRLRLPGEGVLPPQERAQQPCGRRGGEPGPWWSRWNSRPRAAGAILRARGPAAAASLRGSLLLPNEFWLNAINHMTGSNKYQHSARFNKHLLQGNGP